MNEQQQPKASKAGLVLGIIGIVCDGISFFACWWLCIVGMALGLIAMLFPRKVCGIVAMALGAVALIVTVVVFRAVGIWR